MTNDMLAMWRLWQESQGLSDRTITERAATIRQLLILSQCGPLELTPDHIVAYTARKSLSAASKATYHATIRAYCAWLVRTDQREDDPSVKTPRPRRIKSQPRPVPAASFQLILSKVNRRRTSMMILLAALAGLRVHEVAKFRGEDLDRTNGIITVTGKGGKTAMIPAHQLIVQEAATFPSDGYWFPAYPSQTAAPHITPGAVSKAIMDTMARAGVPGRAHQLRHWYGTELLREGVDLRVVQTLMRHESPATTAIYTLVDFTQQRAGMDRLHLPDAA